MFALSFRACMGFLLSLLDCMRVRHRHFTTIPGTYLTHHISIRNTLYELSGFPVKGRRVCVRDRYYRKRPEGVCTQWGRGMQARGGAAPRQRGTYELARGAYI